MRSHIPASTLATVSGAGHAVHFEEPEETAEVINKFIRELEYAN
jgi:pimeloyl-ACP methyl ester carboxylesterase